MLYRSTFNQIAAAVALIPDVAARAQMAKRMADILENHNPNFDYTRFLNACTTETKDA